MPTFHRHESVPDIAHANFDKIRIFIKQAYRIRFESMEGNNAFKAALGQSELFSRGNGRRSSIFSVKGAPNLGERWLFHGSTLTFRMSGEGMEAIGSLDLMLNLSRFINHHVHEAGSLANIESIPPREAVERNLHLPQTAYALDGNDNIIPVQMYRQARPAIELFNTYLDKVLALIGQIINSTLRDTQRRSSYALSMPMREWSVPHSEIYWEYSVSNPIAFLNGLRTFLLPQFSTAELEEYAVVIPQDDNNGGPVRSWGISGNAPCLKLNLGSKNVQLVVYAKTFERVRFEIRYNANLKSNISSMRQVALPEHVNGIGALLEPAIHHAHRHLRRVFEAMPDLDFSERCEFQVFVEFLAALAEACRDAGMEGQLQNIMALLASNGSLEVGLGSMEHTLCEHLARNGIIRLQRATRNANAVRRYCLNPRYTNSLAAMLAGVSNV